MILSDLRSRQHLDAYVAIFIGLGLAILGLLGSIWVEVLAAGILMTMSFVVWTALTSRHQLAELALSIERMHHSNGILRFAEFPDAAMRQQLRAAKDISLSAQTFLRFFPLFGNDLEHALLRGAQLRVILADPESAVFDMASFRSYSHIAPEIERQRVLATIEFLADLRKRLSNAKIEVRKYPYLLLESADHHAAIE